MRVDREVIDRINELEVEINRFIQLSKILGKNAEYEIVGMNISFTGGSTLRIPIDLAGEVITKVIIPAYEETAERILGEENNED